MNRGIESFFREAYEGLKCTPGLQLRLLKAGGCESLDERVGWSLHREGRLARVLGALVGRNGYVVEQWSFLPAVIAEIRAFRPHVVFYSDANLGFLLFWLRRWIGIPFRLLFSNGGPVHPPFVRTDFVHQPAPVYHAEAIAAGEMPGRHFLLPYGIRVPNAPAILPAQERAALRRKLRLPPDRPIVLSVGWVSSAHKRMDYVIQEIARLNRPRPYLQLLGAMDSGSRVILESGEHLLGTHGFGARSVPYEEVCDYYRTADCFVLASLQEGFGRVYLEALMHGLPAIAHDNPVTRYVLGPHGLLADLTRHGALADLVSLELKKPADLLAGHRRWAHVRQRFSWPVLAPGYCRMFRTCAREQGRRSTDELEL